mgnify:CR=1 FL=1
MSTLKKIDDAYNMYILCDKNIKRTTDITTLSGVTLRKYVKIKESLDFELTEFLDKKGKLKLTISDALKLCEKVINPEYQYLIFDKFINSPKKDRFRLLSEECTCMICAEESVNFEFTPCCHNPIY